MPAPTPHPSPFPALSQADRIVIVPLRGFRFGVLVSQYSDLGGGRWKIEGRQFRLGSGVLTGRTKTVWSEEVERVTSWR